MQAQGFTFRFSMFYHFQEGDSHFPHRLDSIIKINLLLSYIIYYKEEFVETKLID